MTADQIAQILDTLGQKLGPTGKYVFDLAVRQVYINGVSNIIIAVVFGLLAWGLSTVARRHRAAAWTKWNAHPTNYPTIDGHPTEDITVAAPSAIGYLVSVIFVIVAVACLLTALSQLLNPEYAAIKDILGSIKP